MFDSKTWLMRPLLRRIVFYPKSLWLKLELLITRRLLSGPYAWFSLERLGVPGWGTALLRVDFPPPVNPKPRWGYGTAVHGKLKHCLQIDATIHEQTLEEVLSFADVCLQWPACQDTLRPDMPWRQNSFLTFLDQVALYGMLRSHRPSRYIEVGSGISTLIASRAGTDGDFPMEITSIDPEPRLDVKRLCHRVIGMPLEHVVDKLLELATNDSVVFFDGSHRCFPSSDVTVFFMEILPHLPPGTLVHIHDIYLPSDYPLDLIQRLWSEQYLLAVYLLGGSRRVKVLLPCAFLMTQANVVSAVKIALRTNAVGSSSIWLQIT